MKNIRNIFATSCLVLTLFNCVNHKKNNTNSINETLLTFIEEIKIDTFNLDDIEYSGVVYLFARNVNDSILIHLMPTQCIFIEEDLNYSFEYAEKLFLCQGDIDIFKSLVVFNETETKNLNQKRKLCNDIGRLDIYDPKDISLLLAKDQLIMVSLPQTTITKVVFGEELPPLPYE
jgi:hypothetical protein